MKIFHVIPLLLAATATEGQGAPATCLGAFGKLLLPSLLWPRRQELHLPDRAHSSLLGQQAPGKLLERSEEYIKLSPGHLGRCHWLFCGQNLEQPQRLGMPAGQSHPSQAQEKQEFGPGKGMGVSPD